MPPAEPFAPREPINKRAFALRHMLLEEIKWRRAAGDAAGALERIARGLAVEAQPREKCFVLLLEGREAARVPMAAVALYRRGDTSAGVREQAGARRPGLADALLQENRRVAAEIVDRLQDALE